DLVFNPPPGWPQPPANWKPPKGWMPDPAWPHPPDGWQLWVPRESQVREEEVRAESSAEEDAAGVRSKSFDEVTGVAFLVAENAALKEQLKAIQASDEGNVFNDEWVLQEAGIYHYHHPLEDAAAYQERLQDLSSRVAEM